jgi:serine/threonine protein kinase
VAYAPPEVIIAYTEGAELVVEPSIDIWSVGIVVFECLVRGPVFPPFGDRQTKVNCALGVELYPWELPSVSAQKAWKTSRARSLFESCLSRDPGARPTAREMLQGLHKISNTSTTKS